MEASTCTTHQQPQETNIHVLGGSGTNSPSKLAAADLRLKTMQALGFVRPMVCNHIHNSLGFVLFTTF
jgi:hypothetical protein